MVDPQSAQPELGPKQGAQDWDVFAQFRGSACALPPLPQVNGVLLIPLFGWVAALSQTSTISLGFAPSVSLLFGYPCLFLLCGLPRGLAGGPSAKLSWREAGVAPQGCIPVRPQRSSVGSVVRRPCSRHRRNMTISATLCAIQGCTSQSSAKCQAVDGPLSPFAARWPSARRAIMGDQARDIGVPLCRVPSRARSFALRSRAWTPCWAR